ncbi:hypothetical protein [Symbioplanes lichenis]|uniref:hypothetical protein n=1 Tax=Symbioplanes lichenis TaxID=1629072 RepID=UPI0027394325|nr:hypothetical protein [Actinoplanes lichenis]
MPHQRSDTHLPDATEATTISEKLELSRPGAPPATAPQNPWKDINNPVERKTLAGGLLSALGDRLTRDLATHAWKERAGTIGLDRLAGAGLAAKKAVDDQFGEWTAGAALTDGHKAVRALTPFTPGVNLFDLTDGNARILAEVPISANEAAK